MGLHFLAFWLCGPSFPCILALWAFISLHFGRVGLHFLAFWPCGSSFPCVLAFWAFISFHFGLAGLHFLAFWLFRGQLLGPPPQVAKNGPFAQRPYNGFSSAVTGPILQFFSLLGLHFLAFWPCGPSFPFILAFWALWAFISLHFGLVRLHFLAFWLCRLSFPCILALWAFISFHFGPFGGQLLGPPPTSCKNCPFAQCPYKGFISAVTGPILQFLAFWALWAFLSLHFGISGLDFFSFWCNSSCAGLARSHACNFRFAHFPSSRRLSRPWTPWHMFAWRPGRPAPPHHKGREMLPGCPTPRPPSCTGRGCLVGPPPTDAVLLGAPGPQRDNTFCLPGALQPAATLLPYACLGTL